MRYVIILLLLICTVLTLFDEMDLQTSVNHVLDAFAAIDPLIVKSKIKLHLLVHASEDSQRFGPLVGRITEVFEKANAIFRTCSVLSNRQAPSIDIALQLAEQHSLQHLATGGLILSKDGDVFKPSQRLTQFFDQHKIIRANLGWTEHSFIEPGMIHPPQ
jgi:hypothetical protein